MWPAQSEQVAHSFDASRIALGKQHIQQRLMPYQALFGLLDRSEQAQIHGLGPIIGVRVADHTDQTRSTEGHHRNGIGIIPGQHHEGIRHTGLDLAEISKVVIRLLERHHLRAGRRDLDDGLGGHRHTGPRRHVVQDDGEGRHG